MPATVWRARVGLRTPGAEERADFARYDDGALPGMDGKSEAGAVLIYVSRQGYNLPTAPNVAEKGSAAGFSDRDRHDPAIP
jgi:hypothetical protein